MFKHVLVIYLGKKQFVLLDKITNFIAMWPDAQGAHLSVTLGATLVTIRHSMDVVCHDVGIFVKAFLG